MHTRERGTAEQEETKPKLNNNHTSRHPRHGRGAAWEVNKKESYDLLLMLVPNVRTLDCRNRRQNASVTFTRRSGYGPSARD